MYAANSDISDLTVSSNDDVTEACVTLAVLMFARTGAPNPIEESWRLVSMQKTSSFRKAHG